MSDESAAAPETPAEKPQESPLEKRLASLIGQQKDLVEQNTAQKSEIGELKELVAGLASKLESTSSAAPPASVPADSFALGSTPDPAASNSQSFQEAVNKAVQEALAPITTQNAADQAKLQKHQQAYAQVTSQQPAFADPTSEEARLFNQLYNSRSDLRQLDDAPSVIAEMVNGLVGDKRFDAQRQELEKARATLPQAGGRAAPQGDPEKLRENFGKLVEKMQTVGNLTPQELGDYLNYKTALAHLEE